MNTGRRDRFNTAAQFRVGVNLVYRGRYEESLTAMRSAQRFNPPLWAFQTSFALFQLYGVSSHQYIVAAAYARMNKPRPALQYLRQAADNGFPCYTLFEKDTNLDSLRGDPRFRDFMTQQKKQWNHFKATM